MITYMTRKSIGASAGDLNTPRLALQLSETRIILDVLCGIDRPEIASNHPILKAWEGYEYALCVYGMMHAMEWHMNRGYADKTFFDFNRICEELRVGAGDERFYYDPPSWFDDTDVLRSHRSNLLRRDSEHFEGVWGTVDEDWPYLWPFVDGEGEHTLMLSKSDKAMLKTGERKLPKSVRERVANL